MKKFGNFHGVGNALLLPVALLPFGSLLIRFGQGDTLTAKLLLAAGEGLYDGLPLAFAIVLGCSLLRGHESFGMQPLNAALGYFLMLHMLKALAPQIQHAEMSCALLSGFISAHYYPRLARIKLPPSLLSYHATAILIMLNGLICLLVAVPLALIWSWLEPELLSLGHSWLSSPEGGFAVGWLYQLLTPFGLHSLLNELAQPLAPGGALSGEQLNFLSGLYSVKMFGLPGLSLALLSHAPSEQRHAYIGICVLLTVSAMITGVIEPVVLALLFISPTIFLIHAFLSGLVMAFAMTADLQLAIPELSGTMDMIFNHHLQRSAPEYYGLGLVTLTLYAGGITLLLQLFDLRLAPVQEHDHHLKRPQPCEGSDVSLLAIDYLKALGGIGNLISLRSTITYLAVEVESPHLIDNERLQSLGVITRCEKETHKLQLLTGPVAVQLEHKIQQLASRQSLDLRPKCSRITPYVLQ